MHEFFQLYGYLIVTMFLQAILALSLYLPLMTGQLSLASPGFYAIGGYVAAILSTEFFPSGKGLYPMVYVVIEIVLAVILCGIVAALVGFIALRLRGIYLALATIAFVEIVRVGALAFVDITGGAPGIAAIPQPVDTQFGYILIALPLLVGCMALTRRIERIRVGRAFLALREDELAAASIGVNPMGYKTLAFTLGAIMAGIAGAVSAHLNNTWNPSYGSFDLSILILAYVLVGGSRTYLGPVVGAFLLTALPEALRALGSLPGLTEPVSKAISDSRLVIFGILIALAVIFFPQGLVTPERLARLQRKPKPPRPAPTAPASPAGAGQ